MVQPFREALVNLRKEKSHCLADQTPADLHFQRAFLLALVVIIPLVATLSTSLWLRSAYTSHIFHLQGFLTLYGSGVYRYRILGRELLLWTYRVLAAHHADRPFPMPTDPDATLLFYGAYVLLNAVFFFFSNLALLLLLSDGKKRITDLHLALYFFLVLLLALSTYTVTPYDQIAYFLLLVCFLSMRFRRSQAMYLVLGIAAVVGGLNRETEYLVTPALLTIACFTAPESSKRKRYCYAGLFHLLVFAACYIALRLAIPGIPTVAGGITLGGKWALPSLTVLCALFYIALNMAAREYRSRRPALVLLLLSAPYIVTILLTGELRELRLLMPLLLCLAFVYIQLTTYGDTTAALKVDPV
jgi:hypothetical protein